MAEEESPLRPESAGSERRSLQAMEAAMRQEIRELQEERAAAMMAEILDLQRERDLALGKVGRLEKKVADIERVCEKRRGEGRAELVGLLKKALLEEQLVSSDMRKKLISLKKQNQSLTQQLRNGTQHLRNGIGDGSPSGLRRQSVGSVSPHLPPKPTSTPPPISPHTPRGQSSSPGYSPSVVPRRYKLTTAASCDASNQTELEPSFIQTDQSHHRSADTETPPLQEQLRLARAEIAELKAERDKQTQRSAAETEKNEGLKRDIEDLQVECGVLRGSLGQLSGWARGELREAEENMDIFRVIYTLHGSLAQEQSVLQGLQKKLTMSEQKISQLNQKNRQLVLKAAEAEEKYNSLAQIRSLQSEDYLSLPRATSRTMGRKFSSPQLLPRHPLSFSPLTTHTPSHHHDIV